MLHCPVVWVWFGCDSVSCWPTELWTYCVPEAGFEHLIPPASPSPRASSISESWLAHYCIGFLLLSLAGSHILHLPTHASTGSKSTATRNTIKTHRAHRVAWLLSALHELCHLTFLSLCSRYYCSTNSADGQMKCKHPNQYHTWILSEHDSNPGNLMWTGRSAT